MNNIGHVIRTIRKSKGITATFMAKELGYKAVSSYIRLENGESKVTLVQGKKISEILNMDINDFFKRSKKLLA